MPSPTAGKPSRSLDTDAADPPVETKLGVPQLLIAAVVCALASAACFEFSAHARRLWINPQVSLGISELLAAAAAICLCAVASPTLRGSLTRALTWLRTPVTVETPSIPWLIPIIIFQAAAFALYGRAIGIGYLCDDWGLVQNADTNVLVPHGGIFWRPVVNTSFWIDDKLWGHRPAFWHVENVLVYGLTVYLVYLLTKALARSTGSRGAAELGAWCAAALFLVVPGHGEAVNWLCDRSDLYGTAFVLAGLLAYLRYRENDGRRSFVLCAVCFALGLLSKEAMVAVPIAVVVAELWRRRWINALIIAVIDVGYLIARSISIGKLAGGYAATYNPHMLVIAVFFHLVGEFPFPALPLLLLVAGYTLRRTNAERRRAALGFAAITALYCLALLPVSTTSPGPEGNRFVYLPSAFSCALFGLAIAWLTHERRRLNIAVAVLATVVAIAPFPRVVMSVNRDWIRAGEYTRASIANAHAAGSSIILPADRVDSIGRAYVWRNGGPLAVKLGER